MPASTNIGSQNSSGRPSTVCLARWLLPLSEDPTKWRCRTGREDVDQLRWCHDLVATDERQLDQLVQVLPVEVAEALPVGTGQFTGFPSRLPGLADATCCARLMRGSRVVALVAAED